MLDREIGLRETAGRADAPHVVKPRTRMVMPTAFGTGSIAGPGS